jgi:hypothetical protein
LLLFSCICLPPGRPLHPAREADVLNCSGWSHGLFTPSDDFPTHPAFHSTVF